MPPIRAVLVTALFSAATAPDAVNALSIRCFIRSAHATLYHGEGRSSENNEPSAAYFAITISTVSSRLRGASSSGCTERTEVGVSSETGV